jgi:hypothetical protein
MQPNEDRKGRIASRPIEPGRDFACRPRDSNLADLGDRRRVAAHSSDIADERASGLDRLVLDSAEAGAPEHVDQGLRIRIERHHILLAVGLLMITSAPCRRQVVDTYNAATYHS